METVAGISDLQLFGHRGPWLAWNRQIRWWTAPIAAIHAVSHAVIDRR
ncbi:MAG: hypothetical protein WA791_17730 [Rhodomicrobium sp.]